MSRQIARTAFTPAISRENTADDREQIKKAKLIRRASALSIRHLFAVIGTWSPYYARAILTNSLVWGAIEVHVVIFFFLTVSADNINFQGISTESLLKYTPIPDLRTFSLQNISKISKITGTELDENDSLVKETPEGFYEVKRKMEIFGGILGAVATVIMRKWPHRRKILVAAVVYLASIVLAFIGGNYPIAKLVLVTIVACKEVCLLAVLMNLAQNLPSHIRPIALFWVTTASSVFATSTILSLRLFSWWFPVGLVVPILLLLSAVGYFFLAPKSLLLIVLEQHGDKLKRLIKKYREDRPALDGNTLIDDVIYIRPATVSSWKRCLKLLTVKAFIFKYLILIGLRSILHTRLEILAIAIAKLTNFGLLETKLINYVAVFFGGGMAMIMLHFFGRRLSLVSSYLFNAACFAVLLTIPLTKYNSCSLFDGASTGEERWTHLAIAANFLQTISFYTAENMVTLMLLEHIPVEDHKYLVPLAAMIVNIAVATTRIFVRHHLVQNALSYPNIDHLICFILTLLFGILLPFLDNTRVLPLKSDDFRCYYFQKKKYPRHPNFNDDSGYNETELTTYSATSRSHSATIEEK